MVRALLLGVMLVGGCLPASTQHVYRMEGRLDALEKLYTKRVDSEIRLRAEVEAMRVRVATLKEQLRTLRAASGFPSKASVAPSNPYSAAAVPSPSVDELMSVWKDTGVLLNDLHGKRPDALLAPLIQAYLGVNIHGGLVNEGLRRDYVRRLRTLHERASELARAPDEPETP